MRLLRAGNCDSQWLHSSLSPHFLLWISGHRRQERAASVRTIADPCKHSFQMTETEAPCFLSEDNFEDCIKGVAKRQDILYSL